METIHPITVHFPIALVLTATLISILALLIKPKRKELITVLYWIMLLGSLSVLTALLTGIYESGKVVHNETIHEIMETHELLGYIVSASFILLTLWGLFKGKRLKVKELFMITSLLVATSGVLVYSAYLGGRMVYEEGAGVRPMEKIIEQMHDNLGHSHGSTSTYDDGQQSLDEGQLYNHDKTLEHSHDVD